MLKTICTLVAMAAAVSLTSLGAQAATVHHDKHRNLARQQQSSDITSFSSSSSYGPLHVGVNHPPKR